MSHLNVHFSVYVRTRLSRSNAHPPQAIYISFRGFHSATCSVYRYNYREIIKSLLSLDVSTAEDDSMQSHGLEPSRGGGAEVAMVTALIHISCRSKILVVQTGLKVIMEKGTK